MGNAVLDKLIQERSEVQAAAVAIAESDTFNPDDPTYVELRKSGTDLDGRITSLAELLEQQQSADALDAKLAKATTRQQQRQTDLVQTRSSWGQQFVDSDQFRSYGQRGTSSRLELDLDGIETRALPTSVADLVAAGLKGTIAQVDTTPAPAPTPLLDNVNRVQVSGNSIEFIAWAKKAGGATVVAEEALKPSAEWGPTVTPAVLDTIAVWTQLTRQMVEDYATVRSYIDGELQRDVVREEEAQATAAVTAAAAAIPDATSDSLLGAIRVGIGTIQGAGYNPSAVLLNPADWAAMDVGVMGDTLNGPVIRQQFWGLSVIPSMSQTAGTALVGDFRTAITQFFRSAVALYVTDSHGDTFIHNVFTLLAERRSKTVVVRPQALVQCTEGP
jgi:HK97 family phage major capsid protein